MLDNLVMLFKVHSGACKFYPECLNFLLRKLVFVGLAIWLVGSVPGNGVVQAGWNDRIYVRRSRATEVICDPEILPAQ